MPTGIGAGIGALFRTLAGQKLNDARIGLYQQQLAQKQALDESMIRQHDAATALANNQLGGLNSIAGGLASQGVPMDRASLIASAIQANKGANFNTTAEGLGRLFLQNQIGDSTANLQSIGSPLTRVSDGMAYNPSVAPDQSGLTLTDVGKAMVNARNAAAGASRASAGASGALSALRGTQNRALTNPEQVPGAAFNKPGSNAGAAGGDAAPRGQLSAADSGLMRDAFTFRKQGKTDEQIVQQFISRGRPDLAKLYMSQAKLGADSLSLPGD